MRRRRAEKPEIARQSFRSQVRTQSSKRCFVHVVKVLCRSCRYCAGTVQVLCRCCTSSSLPPPAPLHPQTIRAQTTAVQAAQSAQTTAAVGTVGTNQGGTSGTVGTNDGGTNGTVCNKTRRHKRLFRFVCEKQPFEQTNGLIRRASRLVWQKETFWQQQIDLLTQIWCCRKLKLHRQFVLGR